MRRFAFHILLAVATLSTLPVEGRPLSDCTHAARLEVAGYAGTETLAGVPVLVRLSESIPGFHYADCGTAGAGLVFCDEANEVVFPHEIDEWNPDGESLVWVRLPSLAAGTAFQMGWGGTAAAPDSHAVWSDYAGVWHMNEASGTAFDSTTNGLDAVPGFGANGSAATLAQIVACEDGACGRARVNATTNIKKGNYMQAPSYDALGMGDEFSVSIWFRGSVPENYPRLVSRKNANEDAGGFEIALTTDGRFDVRGGSADATDKYLLPPFSDTWVNLVVSFRGRDLVCYTNGSVFATLPDSIAAADDNGTPLAFGNKPSGNGNIVSFVGQYDEIRLRGGTLSADRIRADYDTIANRNFLSFGTVVGIPDAPTVLAEGDLVSGVTICLGGAPDGWTLHYTTDGSTPTADSPVYTGLFTLAESATVKAVAVNDDFGWTTGVAEQRFDLAPPLAVTDAQARQRYPWNGLVDVDFMLAGDTAKCYRVSLDVTDLDGGTNLAARTVWEDGGTLTNAVLDVAPGAHRFVWNAGADLPEGFVADRVAVSLRAEYLHDTALYMVVDLSSGPDAAHYPVSYLPDVPEGGWTDEYKTEKLVLRRLEPGWFTMGSPEDEVGRYPARESARDVKLTAPLMSAVFETTQRQFELVTGTNCAHFGGANKPVEDVPLSLVRGDGVEFDWPTIRQTRSDSFVGRLSRRSGLLLLDLPTEAQWEYVCRAGTRSPLNNGGEGDSEYAKLGLFDAATTGSNEGYAAVGEYMPNAWNIYDMHGNVYERCLDWFEDFPSGNTDPVGPVSGEARVKKGGSWYAGYRWGRSAYRDPTIYGYNAGIGVYWYDVGFRLFLHNAPAVVEAPIVAPENLAATTNRTGDVTLSWEPVTGAYAYQIRRSKSGAFEDGTWLNTVTNTTYADWTAEARTDYTYWVRAQFESGKVGMWSETAEGCRHKGYTVHFDANGGTGEMADLELRFDEPQALTGCGFSKSGNVFAGWATTAGGSSVYADGETVENLSLEPGAIVTLYACWATSSYTVKFNANGGSGSMANQTLTYGIPQQLRAKLFTRNKYRFVGWATSAAGSVQYADKAMVTNLCEPNGTITLYAKWTENSLGEGIDQPDLVWTTDSKNPWSYYTKETEPSYYPTWYSYDKIDGVKSSGAGGGVADSWLQTTISGPATFSLRYALYFPSSTFTIKIDNNVVLTETGAHSSLKWTQKSFSVGSGTHTIRFNYHHSGGGYDGRNGARLDTMTVTYQ